MTYDLFHMHLLEDSNHVHLLVCHPHVSESNMEQLTLHVSFSHIHIPAGPWHVSAVAYAEQQSHTLVQFMASFVLPTQFALHHSWVPVLPGMGLQVLSDMRSHPVYAT